MAPRMKVLSIAELQALRAESLRIMAGYPAGHGQRRKILEQVEEIDGIIAMKAQRTDT